MSLNIAWNVNDDRELRLRLRPLREHWEARGPGMLHFANRCLPWLQLPNTIEVRLIPPVTGAGGRIVDTSTIEFAAVLANPLRELPEVVRLAWLILAAACQVELPHDLHPTTLTKLIPLTLEAAEYVELARSEPAVVKLAMDTWLPLESPRPVAADLMRWWDRSGRDQATQRQTWLSSIQEDV